MRRLHRSQRIDRLGGRLILNVIYQGETIFSGSEISWIHLLMNYLVPYRVASYSAAKNELTRSDNE